MGKIRVIEVFLRDELLSEHHFVDTAMKIGRAKWNDIILTDPTVSRDHAKINIESGKLTIVDSSSGGTFINSEKVLHKTFATDDRITIGPYSLFIREFEEKSKNQGLDSTMHDKTVMIRTDTIQAPKSFLLHQASLHIVDSSGKQTRFAIKKERVTLGKSEENDLVLRDEIVSRHHGEICYRNGQFFIRDIGSRNGIFLNGKKVQGAIMIPGSRIEIGENRIDFLIIEETGESPWKKDDRFKEMIGESKKFRSLCTLIKKAASCDATVLICGDTGTGKELVAKTIHSLSERSSGPFVTVDCGSIPRELIESEFFGHEKGAFTGAQNQRKGAFELGHKGTVFFDEIGELPKDLQPKLLRILEERSFKRVGGDSHIQTDVRVIAATNRELNKEVMEGNFREDLYFRLYVVPIFMPSLSERAEDIPLLADFFIGKAGGGSRGRLTLDAEALKKLKEYSWPGNIRELKNTIERAVVNADGNTITADEIQFIAPITKSARPSFPSQTTLEEIEKQTISDTLKAQNGNKKATAKLLGIAYSTMCEKVKKYGIEV